MSESKNERLPLFSMETKRGRILNQLIYPVAYVLLYIIFNFVVLGKIKAVNPEQGWNVLLNWKAFSSLIIQSVPNMFIAWGLLFLFSAGPDFSCAAILQLACVAAAIVAQTLSKAGASSLVCYIGFFIAGIGLQVLLQLSSTLVRRVFNLSAWVCGFAMMIFYEGIGSFYSQAMALQSRPVESLSAKLCRDLPKMPWPVILVIVGVSAHYFIMNRTTLGIEFRAVGSNPQVAGYMGINSRKVAYMATIVGALFLGLSACYSISYAAKINLQTGMGSMAMLGKGLSTFLISNAINRKLNPSFAILLSGLFLATFFNVLTRLGVPSGTWQEFIMGVFIVVFASIAFAGNKEVVK